MSSTRTHGQLYTATSISLFVQCQVSFRLLPASVDTFMLIEIFLRQLQCSGIYNLECSGIYIYIYIIYIYIYIICYVILLSYYVILYIMSLNINNKRLQRHIRHIRTRATLLWNRKNASHNFVVIFKILPFDRNKT